MGYVRVLDPSDFDHVTGEFNDLAFKKYGGGLSVIEATCAERTSGSICVHIRRFYANLTGEPPIFFLAGEGAFPEGSEFAQTDVGNGDPCHWDVTGRSDKVMKRMRHRHFSEYSICDNGTYRPLTHADISGWKMKHASS